MATCSGCSETSKRLSRGNPMARAGLLLWILLFSLLSGCAGSQLQSEKGYLNLTNDVTRLFETNTVLPDHVYYYSGPEAEPEAIIGIQAGFAFQGKYWQKVDSPQGQMMAWNRRIDNPNRIRLAYKGARIMTPDGRQVGVWFSIIEHTVVRFPDAKTILIYAPSPPITGGFLDGGREDSGDKGRGPRN